LYATFLRRARRRIPLKLFAFLTKKMVQKKLFIEENRIARRNVVIHTHYYKLHFIPLYDRNGSNAQVQHLNPTNIHT